MSPTSGSALVHPLEMPKVGGRNSTTTSPATPAGPWWMWAALAGAMRKAVRV
jgi:hypothetical protein